MRKAGCGLSAAGSADVPFAAGQDGWARSRTNERGLTVSWPPAPTSALSCVPAGRGPGGPGPARWRPGGDDRGSATPRPPAAHAGPAGRRLAPARPPTPPLCPGCVPPAADAAEAWATRHAPLPAKQTRLCPKQPHPSLNGSGPQAGQTRPITAAPAAPARRKWRTRIGSIRTGLITGPGRTRITQLRRITAEPSSAARPGPRPGALRRQNHAASITAGPGKSPARQEPSLTRERTAAA